MAIILIACVFNEVVLCTYTINSDIIFNLFFNERIHNQFKLILYLSI